MITLLGTFLGLFGSFLPQIVNLFRESQNNKHELAILDRNIEMQKISGAQKMDEIVVQAQAADNISARQYSPPVTGIKFVDAIANSVRPITTYSFFALYCAVKYAQYDMLINGESLPWQDQATAISAMQALSLLWNAEDQALFASILAFWFGGRLMKKGG